MPALRKTFSCLTFLLASVAPGQTAPRQTAPATPAALPPVVRTDGTDAPSGMHWVRFRIDGTLVKGAPNPAGASGPTVLPTLIAQCTQRSDGPYRFEMFASFGDAADLTYYPPWKPASPDEAFPPRTAKVTLTMEFLGYTHVKPIRRQWEIPAERPGLYRYNSPGSGSSNLEDINYDLRYLLALPTLRLTLGDRTAEFQTAPLLAAIRSEPTCRAAGL